MDNDDLKLNEITVDLNDGYGDYDSSVTYVSSNDDYTITLDDSYNYSGGYGATGISGDFGNITWGHDSTFNKGLNIDEDGDITLGKTSLKEFISKVEKRLAILQPNEELEEQWEELKKLGDKYRELEEQLLERNKIMEILKED
jgi:hypothetical protein